MEASPDRKVQTTTDHTISTSHKVSEMSSTIASDASKTVSPDCNTSSATELALSTSKVTPLHSPAPRTLKQNASTDTAQDTPTANDGNIISKLVSENNPGSAAITDNLPTTPKSRSPVSPSVGFPNIADKTITGIEQTTTADVKVNSNPSPAFIMDNAVKVDPVTTSNLRAVKSDPAIHPRNGGSSPAVQLKSGAQFNNKENIQPIPAGSKNVATTLTTEVKTNSAMSGNRDAGELKRLRELQAKCRARGINTYGSPTQLLQRLLAMDQREREFEQEHERQMKELRKQKAENPSSSTSQASSRASSPGNASQATNGQSQVTPAISPTPAGQRQANLAGTKIRSPTMPNTTKPFAKSSVSQQIQSQSVVDSAKTKPMDSTRPFASQDIRLEPNAMPTKVVAANTARSSAPQTTKLYQAGLSASSVASNTARRFASQDIRVYRDAQHASPQIIKAMPQDNNRLSQAAKPTNVKVITTSRAEDNASYIHTHTFELKNECFKRGLPGYGSRKDLVSRLMKHHLNNLKAEYKRANEYARIHDSDSEAMLKKQILWFRLECFLEHSSNQIGLSGEPTRAACDAAVRAGKYFAPRHARIMKKELAKVTAQEKALQADKAKKGF